MSGPSQGDFMVESPDKKTQDAKLPPIAADSLQDPLSSSELKPKPAPSSGVAKEMAGGGDFARLGDKLPL